MQFDQNDIAIMKRWNLDNLEEILSSLTNKQIHQPMWTMFLDRDYDGLDQALLALIYNEKLDYVENNMQLVAIEESPNPLKVFQECIKRVRLEQESSKVDNILLVRWAKSVVDCYRTLGHIDHIKPIAVERAELLADKNALKNIFGEDWQRYYRPTNESLPLPSSNLRHHMN